MFQRIVVILSLTALCIYLLVSAPVPLADNQEQHANIPIAEALSVLAAENAVVRSLWTEEIVGEGAAVGLEFDEDWLQPELEAGPLPALFLRAAAGYLQAADVQVGLFLGSDAPLSRANAFKGEQAQAFARLRRANQAQFFYADDVELYTAMFADEATSQACVDCHNEHPEAPRRDWKLGDIMGATTWTYPRSTVSPAELLAMLDAYRGSVAAVYQDYLDKARDFERPPSIGGVWPRDGYALPIGAVFMAEAERRASASTLAKLLQLQRSSP